MIEGTYISSLDSSLYINGEEVKRVDRKAQAEAHWKYLEEMFKVMGKEYFTLQEVAFHYQSAFIHGAKHAEEGR